MLLQEILNQVPGTELKGNPLVRILGISYDSRKVRDGHLFVAIKGEKTDGTQFIGEALGRGAVAVASERTVEVPAETAALRVPDERRFLARASGVFFRNPASELHLVAITGTNGKTTTSFLIHTIFRAAGLRSCLVGTLGMQIGDSPFPSERTTPECPDLLLFLRRAVIAGASHGALEVSSHALALKRVLGIKFAIGVFSNLTPDHLDFHGDMESYYQAKRLLFVPEGENRVHLAAVNIDDPWGERLAGEVPCPVLRYGFRSEANVRALDLRQGTSSSDLRIATPGGELSLRSGLIGRPNAYNILAAVSASIGLRIPLESVRAGIESSQGVPGRMERVDCGQPFTVVVDYAHTPDALEKALETLSQLPHRKIITVFGCGGDRDRKKRPLMGEIASRRSDRVIVTSDNPRTEDPERILSEIEPGLKSGGGNYSRIADRREAIGVALHEAGEGDVVLIAGKGHESYQVIGTEAFPFDDRSIAREILHELLDYRGARQK